MQMLPPIQAVQHIVWRGILGAPPLISQNWGGVFFTIGIFVISEIVEVCRHGWPKTPSAWLKEILWGGGVVVFAWIILIGISTVQIVYKDHTDNLGAITSLRSENKALMDSTGGDAASMRSEIASLEAQVLDESEYIHPSEPLFSNIIYLQQAFRGFRYSTTVPGGNDCRIEFTAPKQGYEFASVIAQLSSQGSNCATFGPSLPGIDPDEDRKAVNGMAARTIIFHMTKDDTAANNLFNGLFNYLPLHRSYDGMDETKKHWVWLQFGPDVHWKIERFTKAK